MPEYELTRAASEAAIESSIKDRPQTDAGFTDAQISTWFVALSEDDKDKVMFFALLFAAGFEAE